MYSGDGANLLSLPRFGKARDAADSEIGGVIYNREVFCQVRNTEQGTAHNLAGSPPGDAVPCHSLCSTEYK